MTKEAIECDICHRLLDKRRQPLCASCVQATLYTPRIEQAGALLSREKAHTHVEAILRPGNHGVIAALPEDADYDAIEVGVKSHSFERANVERQAAEARVNRITAKAEQLKQQIEQYKSSAARQKDENARRRDEITGERKKLEKQHFGAIDPVYTVIRKAEHRLNKIHGRTAEAREYICRAESSLAGLKKGKDRDGRSLYWLDGLPIPDLRDMNGSNGRMRLGSVNTTEGSKQPVESYQLISASLDNVCRLMGLCCHYLSVRLPAEIILPHNKFPHAAVLPIDSSYRANDVHYPTTSSSQQLQDSSFSRPRILHLDRPFPQLQKEDPKAAALFREGVVLLAYNIAWLCRSQGVDVGTTFDDICEIGRNLYKLLPSENVGTKRPSLLRNITTATDKTTGSAPATADTQPKFGSHSHSSASHSLAGHEGHALFGPGSSWDVSIHRLTDQLKSYLRKEAQRAEWDIIDTKEWDEEQEADRAVFVGGARRQVDANMKGPAMSVMTVKPSDDEDMPRAAEGGKGRAGWMKIPCLPSF
ncbi:uncharacterized protein LTR77_003961 [Saxophila tyrrhenica]|uniref:Autophagy-related protein 14 n=1 Tax=Saxophila tyrrhenica TaxID=1690608 RepID=A0AAV9PFB1_9PEZI|nr:hypothetical protein LTR77_003961 [Saxophila tyrrhenica]